MEDKWNHKFFLSFRPCLSLIISKEKGRCWIYCKQAAALINFAANSWNMAIASRCSYKAFALVTLWLNDFQRWWWSCRSQGSKYDCPILPVVAHTCVSSSLEENKLFIKRFTRAWSVHMFSLVRIKKIFFSVLALGRISGLRLKGLNKLYCVLTVWFPGSRDKR